MTDSTAALSLRTLPSDWSSAQRALPAPWGVPATLAWTAGGIFLMCSGVWALQAWSLWKGTAPSLPPAFYLLMQPALNTAVVVMVVMAAWITGVPVMKYLALSRPSLGDVLRSIGFGILGFVVLALIMAAIGLLLQAFGVGGASPPFSPGSMSTPEKLVVIATIAFMMVVMAPITEELLFRGLMYRGLEARLGVMVTLLVSSIVFGLIHKVGGFGWDRVIGTTVIGLMLGWLRWRTDGLAVPMMTHAVTNICGASLLSIAILVS